MITTATNVFQFPHGRRIVVLLVLFVLAFLPNTLGDISREAMISAYNSVAVFVYLTLFVFFVAERQFNFDLMERLGSSPRAQIAGASLLGMLPGCGGAIMVVTGYASGRLSFGALVATLTATMGDAAFLLLAEDPLAAAIVLPVSGFAGLVTGLIVDRFYEPRAHEIRAASCFAPVRIGEKRPLDYAVFALFLPGLVFGVMGLMQIDPPSWGAPISLAGALLLVWVWARSPLGATSNAGDAPMTRASEETAFVMIWVLFAFLTFEIASGIFGLDVHQMFKGVAIWTPLIAALVGFVPGCGPQIIVTTLYLSGAIPFGALMANAISNDGDALFPALAISPRDSLIATLITAVPALLIGYFFFFVFPTL